MSKKCPECGEELPNQAHFCGNCGYDFFQSENSANSVSTNNGGVFPDGKKLLGLIAIVIIIAAIVIFAMGFGANDDTASQSDSSEIEMTITEVSGYSYDYDNNKTSYSLMTSALFTKVPSNLDGYLIKTTYYDSNGTRIGQEIDSLSNVYSKEYSQYSSSFAYFDSYKKPNPDYVIVEIEKSGKTIQNCTYEIDQSDIQYLN